MSQSERTEHWAVTVWRNGEEIVTIESNCLSGREISPEDEKIIGFAARNLLGFIGERHTVGQRVGEDINVGHKTFGDGPLGFRHEPLRRVEAERMLADIDAADKRRAQEMPDEKAALHKLFDAWQRLRALGWKEACYVSRPGSVILCKVKA